MKGTAPASHITGTPGWETSAEQELLLELARSVSGGTIVEIGGEFGMSASLFAAATSKDTRIVTIDLFPGTLLDDHKANLAEAGYAGRTEPIKGDSSDVAATWDGGNIDLLFVDGDHSYAGVMRDLTNWANLVAAGGLLVLHDCACDTNRMPHPSHYDVSRALGDWLQSHGLGFALERQVDTTQVYRREATPGGMKWTEPDIRTDRPAKTEPPLGDDDPTPPPAPAKKPKPSSKTTRKLA